MGGGWRAAMAAPAFAVVSRTGWHLPERCR
jgi:hypothetical protein